MTNTNARTANLVLYVFVNVMSPNDPKLSHADRRMAPQTR
jgi:hypothetical protein